MTKPYDDVEKLAHLYHTLRDDGKASYQDIADELGCSVGTISIRFGRWGDKIKNDYSEDDFQSGKYVEELPEYTEDEMLGRFERFFEERFGIIPQTEGREVHAAEFLTIVRVSDISEKAVKDDIKELYGCGELNPCVAISEHQLNDRIIDRFRDEAIGLLVVSEDGIKVISDCTLTKGSTVEAFMSTPMNDGLLYLSKGWLNYACGRMEPHDIAVKTSVRPETIESQLRAFSLL